MQEIRNLKLEFNEYYFHENKLFGGQLLEIWGKFESLISLRITFGYNLRNDKELVDKHFGTIEQMKNCKCLKCLSLDIDFHLISKHKNSYFD
jgi:hypothetical protein